MSDRPRPSRRVTARPDAGPRRSTPATGPRTALGRAAHVATGQRDRREQVIYSPRWRTPLLVDIVIGSGVLVVGLVLAIVWNPIGGGGLGALGALYALLAVRRWQQWSALRSAAGLTEVAES